MIHVTVTEEDASFHLCQSITWSQDTLIKAFGTGDIFFMRRMRYGIFSTRRTNYFQHVHIFQIFSFQIEFQGLDCCSDNAVSFHYVSPNQMYVLDYLVYHMRPYGIVSHAQPLPEKIQFSDITGIKEDSSALIGESSKNNKNW